jgi:MFS family permease
MSKKKNFIALLIPSTTVFISNFCIMALELVASRLIARHLGSSLYTWTGVIGIVLAGITIGNYIGGRIADKFDCRKTLSILFAISSVACISIIILNNVIGNWIFLWKLDWPVRVFTHVTLVFLLPSLLLGMISPVVAKMALDLGFATGRTVGDIYAWGVAGSIAGTFATGYYLISNFGTTSIIWIIAAVLLAIGIAYWIKFWLLYVWAGVFAFALLTGTSETAWAQDFGTSVKLRKPEDKQVLYEDETPYCYVAVRQLNENPDRREFVQDKLRHSEIIMGNIDNLQYFYTKIYAGITKGLSETNDEIRAMIIGGGGYVYPRYLKKHWPNSIIDVVEIDPGVTKAAHEAFGLSQDTPINTITMDARNYVDELLEKKTHRLQNT